MATTTTSKLFTLNMNDWWKGLIMAVLGAIAGFIQGLIDTGTIDWDKVWKAAVIAALAYITKNFFDKPKVVITDVSNETIDAINDGKATARITNGKT